MVALRRKKKDDEEKLSFCSRFSDNRNRRLVLATNEREPFFLRRTSLVVMETHSFFAITLACHYNCYVKEIFTYGIIT